MGKMLKKYDLVIEISFSGNYFTASYINNIIFDDLKWCIEAEIITKQWKKIYGNWEMVQNCVHKREVRTNERLTVVDPSNESNMIYSGIFSDEVIDLEIVREGQNGGNRELLEQAQTPSDLFHAMSMEVL